MSLAAEKILVPATGLPLRPPVEETDPRLNITVVFTSLEATLAALNEVGTLATAWARESRSWYLRWFPILCH